MRTETSQRRPPGEHVHAHAGDLPEEMTPAELRGALERTHDVNLSRIRGAGEKHMATAIRRFDGGTWSRITYAFYAASHEDYHRGQLATYARSMGLVSGADAADPREPSGVTCPEDATGRRSPAPPGLGVCSITICSRPWRISLPIGRPERPNT